MPGVPSSRGCNPCLRQKKKCLASGPICQRCQRLDITCDGLGQVRYLFKEQAEKFTRTHGRSQSVNVTTTHRLQPQLRLEQPLCSDITRLRTAFVAGISSAIHVKYSLRWNFGSYLLDVPRRLGNNEALDAAARCLIATYGPFCAGHPASNAVLADYSRALSALRRCIADPAIAHTSETLCSVMIIMMAQSFLETRPGVGESHAIGAAQILKSRGRHSPQSDFEKKLFLSLRGPVVIVAITVVDIDLTPRQWEELVESGLDDGTPDGATMACLAKIPDLIRRGRYAKARHDIGSQNMRHVIDDLYLLDAKFAITLETLRQRTKAADPMSRVVVAKVGTETVSSICLRMYSLGLATEILIILLLKALEVDTAILDEKLARASQEMIGLADDAAKWLPVGAMSMIVCIAIAWAGAQDAETKYALQIRWLAYTRGVGYTSVSRDGLEDLELTQRRLELEAR